jgi:hypothetical protein
MSLKEQLFEKEEVPIGDWDWKVDGIVIENGILESERLSQHV